MTIQQHRQAKWAVPISIIIASAPAGMSIARAFPDITSMGNYVLFAGIVLAMLASFTHQFISVQCPECGTNLEYYNAKHSKMPRYTCKECGFKGR